MKTVWLVSLGGIGQAIQQQLSKSEAINLVTFSPKGNVKLDIFNEHAVNQFVENSAELPNEIIITTGMLHDKQHMPEKTILSLDESWLKSSLEVNVLPTLNFAKALTRKMSRDSSLKFVSFSARVSSISDNRLGGWHSYRMTKAMLNMLIKNIALEWHLKFPKAIIFGYHPGTVNSQLSKPFQAKIPPDRLFTPEQAASFFLSCLTTRELEHSGNIYDWQKKEIMP